MWAASYMVPLECSHIHISPCEQSHIWAHATRVIYGPIWAQSYMGPCEWRHIHMDACEHSCIWTHVSSFIYAFFMIPLGTNFLTAHICLLLAHTAHVCIIPMCTIALHMHACENYKLPVHTAWQCMHMMLVHRISSHVPVMTGYMYTWFAHSVSSIQLCIQY